MSIKNTIARLFYPFGSTRTVLRGSLRGMKYIVHPAMGATYAFGSDAFHHSFLARKIDKGMTVFDVGGNCGQLALLFGKEVGDEGTVVSFEPIEELADQIRKNADLNHLGNVKVVTAAASDCHGTTTFAYDEQHSTQGTLTGVEPTYTVDGAKTRTVETVSLDQCARDMSLRPDMLKIDVEGGGGCFQWCTTCPFRGARHLH